MPPPCQSHLDLTQRVSLRKSGLDLDRAEAVLSCLNLVSLAESAVIAGLKPRVASRTVLRTCQSSKHAGLDFRTGNHG